MGCAHEVAEGCCRGCWVLLRAQGEEEQPSKAVLPWVRAGVAVLAAVEECCLRGPRLRWFAERKKWKEAAGFGEDGDYGLL